MGQEASSDLLLTLLLGDGLTMSGESTALLQTTIREYKFSNIPKDLSHVLPIQI